MNLPVGHKIPGRVSLDAKPDRPVAPAFNQWTEAPPAPGAGHTVSVIYPRREEAEGVRRRLIIAGIAAVQVDILHQPPQPLVEDGSDEVLKDILVDGAIGAVVGAGVGVAGTLILWASGITLFAASPVVAPLAMLGWFSSLGSLLGAVAGVTAACAPRAGSRRSKNRFSERVMDAIQAGNTVLIVRTHQAEHTRLAQDIIRESLQGRDGIATEIDT